MSGLFLHDPLPNFLELPYQGLLFIRNLLYGLLPALVNLFRLNELLLELKQLHL